MLDIDTKTNDVTAILQRICKLSHLNRRYKPNKIIVPLLIKILRNVDNVEISPSAIHRKTPVIHKILKIKNKIFFNIETPSQTILYILLKKNHAYYT